MITVRLPDGRSVNVNTDDQDAARNTAQKYLDENPLVERGAQLGEEDVSAIGDVGRALGASVVSAAEGIATLPMELAGSDEENIQTVRDFFNKYKPETQTELGKAKIYWAVCYSRRRCYEVGQGARYFRQDRRCNSYRHSCNHT